MPNRDDVVLTIASGGATTVAVDTKQKIVRWRAAYLVGWLFVSLVLYGLLQERLLSRRSDDSLVGPFPSIGILVAFNRLFGVLFAAFQLWRLHEPFSSKAPLAKFALVSLLNVGSTTFQYEALRWVSFPTQALSKSAKVIATMGLGIVVLGKRYGFIEWLQAVVVVAGCAIFSLTGKANTGKESVPDQPFGYVLLLGYLLCDSGTSVVQKRLFDQVKELKWRMMFWANAISAILSLAQIGWEILLVDSSRMPAYDILVWFQQSPYGVFEVIALSVCTLFAQVCIYGIIQEFGPVLLAYAMTTRQMFSVVLSFIIFSHPISLVQILAASAVFCVLFWKSSSGAGGD